MGFFVWVGYHRLFARNFWSMFRPEQYQLLDFGRGWKIEVFNGVQVARETPSVLAEIALGKFDPKVWKKQSQLCFQRADSKLCWQGEAPSNWKVHHHQKTFWLKPTPSGQLGVFPEQATNWEWIENLPILLQGQKALNLFAYTGGTTMALARKGLSVAHVDSAKNVVQWARRNAQDSNLSDHPIRWICEDAMKFTKRELNRGMCYDVLVADPPSYGKGPKKESWKFTQHFADLLESLSQIASRNLKILLLSCHSTGFTEGQLRQLANRYFDLSRGKVTTVPLDLKTGQGRSLNCGVCLRYQRID